MKTTGTSQANRKRAAPNLRTLRAAVSNGSRLLNGLDHRGAWARRLRDLIAGSIADLGGESEVSEGELSLVRRAAMMTLQLELMEQRFAANGGEATAAQLDSYVRASGALRRLLQTLGLKRQARDVTPDPLDYARAHP